MVLLLYFLLYKRRRSRDDEESLNGDKEDYTIRENIVNHDEDGAGEEDNEGYDIETLHKRDVMSRMDRPDLMATNERPLKCKYRVMIWCRAS